MQEKQTDCQTDDTERCCAVKLYRALEQENGLHAIHWDTRNLVLELEYSSELEGTQHLNELSDELVQQVSERSATCKDREQSNPQRGCGMCVARVKRLQGHNQCINLQLNDADRISLKRGVIHVVDDSNPVRANFRRRAIRIQNTLLPREVSNDDPQSASNQQDAHVQDPAKTPDSTEGRPWEALFVLFTFLSMIAGVLTEQLAPDFQILRWTCFGLAYLFGGYFGLRASMESLRERKIDVDFLMVLAAIGAAAVGAPFEGALLLFLFSLSDVLQAFALGRTRNAIKALAKLKPDTALVLDSAEDSKGRLTKVDSIAAGALIQVKPGFRIPLDGVIIRGASSIDQSTITGESLPVDKAVGAEVFAGTIAQDGEFVLQVTKTSSESTIARVINLVEQAREQQAHSERFLEKFEQYYAIGVIAATLLAGLIPPLLLGASWGPALYRAITLMVAASPCALIISTPASILSAIGNGARRGILFKGGVHVEQAASIRAIAFDKTGTLTEGKPVVEDVIAYGSWTETDVLRAAAALESKSDHVIARAISEHVDERNIAFSVPKHFHSTSGIGIRAEVDGRQLVLGSPAVLEAPGDSDAPADETVSTDTTSLADVQQEILRLQREVKTVIVLADENTKEVFGLISLIDRLRPGVREVLNDLRRNGIEHIAMLTGDNEETAKAIANQAGIDEVFPGLLPEHKLNAVKRIEEQYGKTAMIGDGINDAPALAGARLGIAMGAAGTDVALETADIVLMSDDLRMLPYLIALSRKTRKTLVTNISLALGLIAIMIAGIFSVGLALPLAVIGHEGGTVLVSLNGVRLLLFNYKQKQL